MTYRLATSKRRLVKPIPVATATPSLGQRLLAIDAIVDVIFSFSTPRTIISLSKTCRAVGPIVASYFRVAYNPESFLRQFLPDPPVARAFRTLQAETGVIVFGQAACSFLARAPFTETTMNLYVNGSYASQVNDFLTNAGYDVETHEGEFVFCKEGENGKVPYKIVLQVGALDSPVQFQNVSTNFTDVITFDGAYSLFPARYDKEKKPCADSVILTAQSESKFRSFSDRSSWVITFDQASMVSPQLGFGTSIPARHSLYTSSLMVSPPPEKGDPQRPKTGLGGVVLRSKLLRLDHIMCSVKLSGFVQQFLTRQIIAYPERATSHFDAEVSQFLQACFEKADIRNDIPSYSTVWAIMKEMMHLPSDKPGAGGLQWPKAWNNAR